MSQETQVIPSNEGEAVRSPWYYTIDDSKYVLKLRQQPKHSRMCGFGEKGNCY
jgi:hypothetical protein